MLRILVPMLNQRGGAAKFFAEAAPQTWGRIQFAEGKKNMLDGLNDRRIGLFLLFLLGCHSHFMFKGFAFNLCLTYSLLTCINNAIFPDLIEDSFAEMTCYFRGATHFAMIREFLLLFSVIAEWTCKSLIRRQVYSVEVTFRNDHVHYTPSMSNNYLLYPGTELTRWIDQTEPSCCTIRQMNQI